MGWRPAPLNARSQPCSYCPTVIAQRTELGACTWTDAEPLSRLSSIWLYVVLTELPQVSGKETPAGEKETLISPSPSHETSIPRGPFLTPPLRGTSMLPLAPATAAIAAPSGRVGATSTDPLGDSAEGDAISPAGGTSADRDEDTADSFSAVHPTESDITQTTATVKVACATRSREGPTFTSPTGSTQRTKVCTTSLSAWPMSCSCCRCSS